MATSEAATAFEGNAEQFADYGEKVRGFVRYEITQRNLEGLVTGRPMSVADVGGGSGRDTLWLAELGHTVTLIEPAQDQLDLAAERFANASDEVRGRISVEQAVPVEVVARKSGSFDLVLSHGVAMYMPKPQAFVNNLSALLKPGGHISLLEKGYYGKQAHLVTAGRWNDLESLKEHSMKMNGLDRKAWSFKPHELADLLKRAGIKPLEWSGVRVISDTLEMPVSKLTGQQLAAILAAEYEQGHDEHLRWGGQMLHFIGQKV